MTPRPLSRRHLLRTGLLTVPAAGLLTACGSNGSSTGTDPDGNAAVQVSDDADNPFGVDAAADLDVVIFDGGYGSEYADFHQQLYSAKFPEATVDGSAIQELTQTLQPRFVSGDVPDVIDNSGANRLEMTALIAENQLASLQPLLDAPSIDDPDTPVRDLLIPGVIEEGTFGSDVYALNYVATVYGVWYSRSLFEEKGWEYPRTWDEMLDLCREARSEGIYGWTYGGTNAADYLGRVIMHLAAKNGGVEALARIDNLEPEAWRQDSVLAALEAVYRLNAEDLMLPGSDGLEHTQAQTEWVLGEALFYASGSWIENEMAGITPDGFDMVVAPVPNLTDDDQLDFSAIQVSAGEQFIVPAHADNVPGALEYLRIMLSTEGAQKFSELTGAPTVVRGALDGASDGSTALASINEAMENASETRLYYQYANWYPDLREVSGPQLGNLLTGRVTPEEFADAMQEAADRVAADDSIEKFTRE
ncbi:N-acetylglucosamine/diacetylchitobiose ABC transporter substrate-binding protein [Phytoactinopolyspora mesophila]|uniref:Carbohydrate ABC transporter, N-acetylglucosamine/diacetylchitobiose-binding protein n=1 Tax=Phytoactinopolyspora mesophila TaxID=2650750 RepID=A0A7K3M0K4_9ACTN|nr:N-acetylglucosamine/diacetylchitobiose ABC transporter substrate-binding protein [Phytoactinopolyspora mesophila]NDL56831.1 carbohydrate ABC transporter, N-acetylglucosamine/diacetylchitobiose-binding protein [Phytoactinopolyspora mesophila]